MQSARLASLTVEQVRRDAALDFARFVICLGKSNGSPPYARELFLEQYPRATHVDLIRKAVTVGTDDPASWAGPLAIPHSLTSAFVRMAQARSLLNRIPGLRKVPFMIPVPVSTTRAALSWIGEGHPMKATQLGLQSLKVPITKAGGSLSVTRQLVDFVDGVESLLLDDLADAYAGFIDAELTDPAKAPVVNLSPGSVTNGTTAVSLVAGTDISAQVALVLSALYKDRPPRAPVLILAAPLIVALRQAGARDLRVDVGGDFNGVPVVSSPFIAQGLTIALDAQAICWADSGQLELEASDRVTPQMSDVPDDPVAAATAPLSHWAENLVAFRVRQIIGWQRAVVNAVKYATVA